MPAGSVCGGDKPTAPSVGDGLTSGPLIKICVGSKQLCQQQLFIFSLVLGVFLQEHMTFINSVLGPDHLSELSFDPPQVCEVTKNKLWLTAGWELLQDTVDVFLMEWRHLPGPFIPEILNKICFMLLQALYLGLQAQSSH